MTAKPAIGQAEAGQPAGPAATRAEKLTMYAAGLVQGIALVTFPAASTIFTSASSYGLSAGQYGAMFGPQVVAAISASLLGARLASRFGRKRVYLAGLVANLASMALLVASRFAMTDHAVAYPVLLAATACLGVGFGLTVPAVNTFTADFHPGAVDRSVLVLNALLGLGTTLAPVFVAIFVGLGAWVGLPILAAALLVALVLVSLRLPLRTAPQPASAASRDAGAGHRGGAGRDERRSAVPVRFWAFAGFAVLYGFCETMNGNWSQIDLTALHISVTTASLTLTVFWAMVTAGRVLFAVIQRWLPSRLAYHLLPFLLAVAFLLIAALPAGSPWLGVLAFGLAGLGCSALMPLTISFGQERLVTMSAAVAGGVIACYQLGYGLAAFGVGPLRSAGLSLPGIYAASAVVACVLGALSFAVAHRCPSPAALHPRPAGHVPQPTATQPTATRGIGGPWQTSAGDGLSPGRASWRSPADSARGATGSHRGRPRRAGLGRTGTRSPGTCAAGCCGRETAVTRQPACRTTGATRASGPAASRFARTRRMSAPPCGGHATTGFRSRPGRGGTATPATPPAVASSSRWRG